MKTASLPGNFRDVGHSRDNHWHRFRAIYPRLAGSLCWGIAVTLLAGAALWHHRLELVRENRLLLDTLARAELRLDETLAATEGNLKEMRGAQARHASLAAREMHLAVDSAKGIMYLRRDGAVLREMPIALGPEAVVGVPPDAERLAVPKGRGSVADVLNESSRWEVPAWVFRQVGEPVPPVRSLAGVLGSRAVLLGGGTVIYARPASGLLSGADYLLPGSIRASSGDLEAISAILKPGMTVYLY